MREHLELFLREEGYDATTAIDGPAALELAARGTVRPDLVLADYNLPNGMNGVQVAQKIAARSSVAKFPSSFSPATFRPKPCATSPFTTAFSSTSRSSCES